MTLGIAAFASGCVPILTPPVHGRLGTAYSSTPVEYEGAEGEVETTHWVGMLAVGLDTASVSELPIQAGAGVMASMGDYGSYFEAGPIRRVRPRWRVGATAGAESWWGEGSGFGARTGITVEFTGKHKVYAGSEYDSGNDGTHNATTTYSARAGSFAIGGYLDVGHRWMRDEPNNYYVTFGVSFRLAAMAGIVDATSQH